MKIHASAKTTKNINNQKKCFIFIQNSEKSLMKTQHKENEKESKMQIEEYSMEW